MSTPSPRRFECHAGTSNKFWEVAIAGRKLTTRWGRIGTKGRSTTREFADAEEARAALSKLIAEKQAEGYVESGAAGSDDEADPEPNPNSKSAETSKAKREPKAKPKARPQADRPIDPKVAESVADSWRRIDAWLAEHAPELFKKLGKPAMPEAIARAEEAIGLELPDDIRASYTIHDGSGYQRLFPSGFLLPLDHMVSDHQMYQDFYKEGVWSAEDTAQPKGPIQPIHYHLGWVALTGDGAGDGTLVDLAPAKGGSVGQLIDFSHEAGPEQVAAPSFAAYLKQMADLLDSGGHPIDCDGFSWEVDRKLKATRSTFPTKAQLAARNKAQQEQRRVGESPRRYFERGSGASTEFWEVDHQEAKLVIRTGEVGTAGHSTTRTYHSHENAAAKKDALIEEKLADGFTDKT